MDSWDRTANENRGADRAEETNTPRSMNERCQLLNQGVSRIANGRSENLPKPVCREAHMRESSCEKPVVAERAAQFLHPEHHDYLRKSCRSDVYLPNAKKTQKKPSDQGHEQKDHPRRPELCFGASRRLMRLQHD